MRIPHRKSRVKYNKDMTIRNKNYYILFLQHFFLLMCCTTLNITDIKVANLVYHKYNRELNHYVLINNSALIKIMYMYDCVS